MWIMWHPGSPDGTNYIISNGYGPDHALLLGYQDGGNGFASVTGNVWDGSGIQSFVSFDAVAAGEWHHLAVGWDGTNIRVYIDGVVSGVSPVTARKTGSQQTMLLGGSDHLNFCGRIALLRAMEGIASPYDFHKLGFRPDRVFGTNVLGLDVSADIVLIADYTAPRMIIADMSPAGYNGKFHPGRLRNADNGSEAYHNIDPGVTFPMPAFVLDPRCPVNRISQLTNWGQPTPPAPTAPPSGAKVFDSVGRADSTLMNYPTVAMTPGSTESGSLGVKPWLNPAGWGVFKGRLCYIGPGVQASQIVLWVETGNTDVDVSADINTIDIAAPAGARGIVARLVDAQNFVACELNSAGNIYIQSYIAGTPSGTSLLGPFTPSANFTNLRMTVVGNVYTAYTDGNLIGSGTIIDFPTATKCGIFEANDVAADISGAGRWKNFLVK
jgi:hypothetical protein